MPHGKPSQEGAAPPSPPGPEGPAGNLSDDQIDRWAVIIADGRDRFPEGLSEPDGARLLAAVRQQLRRRLLRLAARAIAAHLHRGQHNEKESEPC